MIIFDENAGYRRFLGADPNSALRLSESCTNHDELDISFVATSEIKALETTFISKLLSDRVLKVNNHSLDAIIFPPEDTPIRFFPQMLDWVASEINHLVADDGQSPAEIVVLSPYLSDSLRFSLSNRLEELQIPWRSHRPSRSLQDEPASRCLLTLAELAHPGWKIHPTKFDIAYAFLSAFDGIDLVRAQLLADIVFRSKDNSLSSFEVIRPEVQERLTFVFGQAYESLREWIEIYQRQVGPDPLDHFLRRLFGEVLSQKGFGFHRNNDSARTAASLIDSIQKFRQVMESASQGIHRDGADSRSSNLEIGREYITMLQEGVISAQYLEAWQPGQTEAVLIAPAYTFLMMNQPVNFQFWLDAGSNGWWERTFQPLTQPYVLSRSWERDRAWTDADDLAANQQALARLLTGLLRRCRKGIFLGLSDLGESGYEQRGPLLKTIWKMRLEIQNQNDR